MFSDFKGSTFESSFHIILDSSTRGDSGDLAIECRVAGPWLLNVESWLVQMRDSRELNKKMYFSRFPPSIDSLTAYLDKGPIKDPNQILFLIVDGLGALYGQVGLKVDHTGVVHLDNILRLADGSPGIIRTALQKVLTWGNKSLGIPEFGLRVISTNLRAIALYQELGFSLQERKNLRIETLPNHSTNLVPSAKENSNTTEELLLMKIKF